MKLSLFNTLTREIEVFKPINSSFVKMYVCGPTVYDRPHIGNARSTVVYDLLFRILKHIYGDNNVCYVRNITDVDDKIINKANEVGISINQITAEITKFFHHDMDYLACLRPSIEPKATEHIGEMIDMIQLLLNRAMAYQANDHVYFDVRKFDGYTRLSGRSLNEMLEEVRIDSSPGKAHPTDFVLWKPAKDSDPATANFDSPFGYGRPGWHIECSAMSHKYLGANFDIHGGGIDLIFPHHTNEIAQTCGAYPESHFANYWVHNGFLTVNKQKMSKSLNNFITVEDLRSQDLNGSVVRLFLLSSHYRKPLDYNNKAIEDCRKTLDYWSRAINSVETTIEEIPTDFLKPLLEDLNTSVAIRVMNEYAKLVNSSTDLQIKSLAANKLLACMKFLAIDKIAVHLKESNINFDKIEKLLVERSEAKKAKNWQKADEIRDHLMDMGVILEDKIDGTTTWKVDNK